MDSWNELKEFNWEELISNNVRSFLSYWKIILKIEMVELGPTNFIFYQSTKAFANSLETFLAII